MAVATEQRRVEGTVTAVDRLRRLACGTVSAAVVAAALAIGAMPVAAADPGTDGVTLHRSGPPVGGEAFTFTPVFTPAFPDGYVFPTTAICSWELRWGDEASILHNDFDATFGSLLLRGKGSDGYCDPWTFTLPYSAAGLWQFAFSYSDESGGASTPYMIMSGTNAAGAGGITESNLPGVWLSLPHGTRQGDMVTATAHPFGGYVLPPGGTHWDAYDSCDCAPPFASESNHALTFTFRAPSPAGSRSSTTTPHRPRPAGRTSRVPGSTPGSSTSASRRACPSSTHGPAVRRQRQRQGVRGRRDLHLVRERTQADTGRTAHLRFTARAGGRSRSSPGTAHGHHASHSVRRYVHR